MNQGDKRKIQQLIENGDEFVFRFPLINQNEESKDNESLNEYIREQILLLLNIVYPCSQGMRVRIDGFQYHNETKTVHDLY